MRMKAAIYTGIEEIEIREVERNEPPPGFVLVDTKQTVSAEVTCTVISGIGANPMNTPLGMKRVA